MGGPFRVLLGHGLRPLVLLGQLRGNADGKLAAPGDAAGGDLHAAGVLFRRRSLEVSSNDPGIDPPHSFQRDIEAVAEHFWTLDSEPGGKWTVEVKYLVD